MLARNVKKLRAQRGLTQAALAQKVNVSQAYIAQLETGVETNPTLATFQRLAKALKVTIMELVR